METACINVFYALKVSSFILPTTSPPKTSWNNLPSELLTGLVAVSVADLGMSTVIMQSTHLWYPTIKLKATLLLFQKAHAQNILLKLWHHQLHVGFN